MKLIIILFSVFYTALADSFSGRIIDGVQSLPSDVFAIRVISLKNITSDRASLSTGVAVTPNRILGTAQAVIGFDYWYIGYGSITVWDQNIQQVVSGIAHPDFNPSTLEFNIAVFSVFNNISSYIPIAVAPDSFNVLFGFGYGRNQIENTESVAYILKSAMFNSVSHTACIEAYNHIVIRDENFCGISLNRLADGDQGGPIVDFGRNYLYGLISFWGTNATRPSVFTDLLANETRSFVDKHM